MRPQVEPLYEQSVTALPQPDKTTTHLRKVSEDERYVNFAKTFYRPT